MTIVRTPARAALFLVAAIAAVATFAAIGAERAKAASLKCPATFQVLHNDSIGKLQLRKGHYEITILDSEKLTCKRASRLFTRFLQDFDGKLPNRWVVKPRKAEFVKGSTRIGFSVERVGSKSGGGGGQHPLNHHRKCPATFAVQHNDRIGQLRLPKGNYNMWLIKKKRISCKRASKLFARFLDHPDGTLPGPWILNVQKASFKRGPTGFGFRVKPVS
jgi:hypothetical protein